MEELIDEDVKELKWIADEVWMTAEVSGHVCRLADDIEVCNTSLKCAQLRELWRLPSLCFKLVSGESNSYAMLMLTRRTVCGKLADNIDIN